MVQFMPCVDQGTCAGGEVHSSRTEWQEHEQEKQQMMLIRVLGVGQPRDGLGVQDVWPHALIATQLQTPTDGQIDDSPTQNTWPCVQR